MAAGDPGVLKRNFSATAIETTLVNSISSAATGDTTTSVSVVSVSGFPTVPYTLILGPDTNKEEVVTVTAANSTTLTVTRGQDGTLAVAHSAGTSVRHGVSGRDFKEEQTHIAARGYDTDTAILSNVGQTHVHGLVSGDGAIVGSDQQVTLTRKTLTTPTINGATLTGTVTSTAAIVVSGAGTITGLSSADMVASSATPKNYVDAILGSATAASTSAASAATSATSAATSATSASNSATASASSASAAATSASSALTSQTAAATSATSAAASATAAATSATSASNSATASASSASASATSASAAATSASSAATSATSSATSASAAATSASSAATSAASAAASTSAAAVSASDAATSATSASASATAAATSATSAATSASSALTSQTAAATSATSAATSASSALTSQTAAATSASSAATSASSAATTYDDFDDRYLGSKSFAPTVDNDGNTLLVGAIYWNSISSQMFVWSGSVWVQIATTSVYTAPTIGSTTIASGTTYSTIANLTLTGADVTLSADPTTNLQAATKQYVDTVAEGLKTKPAVRAATTTNLAANYYNGPANNGVGATLTADTNRAFSTLDGVTSWAITSPPMGVLVKNQTNKAYNGRYNLTTLGDGSTPWVLTRCGLCDTAAEIPGSYIFVQDGTVNEGTGWVQVVDDPATFVVGTDNINVYQFSGAGTYTAGAGLTLTDTTFALDTSGVTAGSYTLSNITVDTYGRITSASTGTAQGETFNPLLLMGA